MSLHPKPRHEPQKKRWTADVRASSRANESARKADEALAARQGFAMSRPAQHDWEMVDPYDGGILACRGCSEFCTPFDNVPNTECPRDKPTDKNKLRQANLLLAQVLNASFRETDLTRRIRDFLEGDA